MITEPRARGKSTLPGPAGEGVYDVAFEGLINNVERRYRETSSETS